MARIKEVAVRFSLISTLAFGTGLCTTNEPSVTQLNTPVAGQKAEQPSSLPQLNAEKTDLTNQQIIDQEIQRLRNEEITVSQTEIDLWKSINFEPITKPFDSHEESRQEAQRRIGAIIHLMQESENPYFKNAASMLIPDKKVNPPYSVIIRPIERLTDDNGQEFSILYEYNLNDAHTSLQWDISVNMNYLLFDVKHPKDAALRFGGLGTIIANAQQQRIKYPSLSPIDALETTKGDSSDELRQESVIYCQILEAELYARSLGLDKASDLDIPLAAYIKTGKDPKNPKWLQFMLNGNPDNAPLN